MFQIEGSVECVEKQEGRRSQSVLEPDAHGDTLIASSTRPKILFTGDYHSTGNELRYRYICTRMSMHKLNISTLPASLH